MKYTLTILFALALTHLHAATIFVNKTAPGNNDGTSWADAFSSIKSAMAAAAYGDEIWVAKGLYNCYTDAADFQLRLKSGVKIYGGFIGTETAVDQRDLSTASATIFYGNTGAPDNIKTQVIFCQGTDSTTVLDGVSVRYGLSGVATWVCENGYDKQYCTGGGLCIMGLDSLHTTNLTIRNCSFKDNTSLFGGGISVLFIEGGGSVQILDCLFEENKGSNAAGALLARCTFDGTSKIILDRCHFINNSVSLGGPGVGGVYIYGTSVQFEASVRNTTFKFNKASHFTAALAISSGGVAPAKVSNCIFSQNTAYHGLDQTRNGALSAYNTIIENCIFDRNRADTGGAAAASESVFVNCLFYGNHANINGGAMDLFRQNTVTNCTFVNNTSGAEGSVLSMLYSTRDTIVNSIFHNNQSANQGGLLYAALDLNLYMDNCLLDLDSCAQLWQGVEPMFAHTDTITCGPNMIWGAAPAFRDTANGDFRLRGCSLGINAGNAAWLAPYGIATDLAGSTRIQDGLPDLGAYESPDFGLTLQATVDPASSMGATDGSVHVDNILGGLAPFRFRWSTGDTLSTAYNLTPGNYTLTLTAADGCDSVFHFQVGILVSGSEAVNGAQFAVWPNPAQEALFVLGEKAATWVLFNALGQPVRSMEIMAAQMATLPLHGLPPGMYGWEVRAGSREVVKKGRVMVVK